LIEMGGDITLQNKKGQSLKSIFKEIEIALIEFETNGTFIEEDYKKLKDNQKFCDLLNDILNLKDEKTEENKAFSQKIILNAIKNNNLTLVKFLHNIGANLNAYIEDNQSPFFLKLKEIEDNNSNEEQVKEMCILILTLVGTEHIRTDKEKDLICDFIADYLKPKEISVSPIKFQNLFLWAGIKFINGVKKFEEILDYLISNGCNPDTPNFYIFDYPEIPLLHLSCKAGNLYSTNFFAKRGANLNARDNFNFSPLHYAVKGGHFEIVKYLAKEKPKKANININITDSELKTPLHLAFQNSNLKAAECLLDCNANINAEDKFGMTPLHYAAKHHQEQIVNLLIQYLAKITKDQYGRTPLHLVCENVSNFEPRDPLKCCEILSKPEIVNVRDRCNKTPLHYAMEADVPNPGMVDLLIKNGADVYAIDEYCQNILPIENPAYPVILYLRVLFQSGLWPSQLLHSEG